MSNSKKKRTLSGFAAAASIAAAAFLIQVDPKIEQEFELTSPQQIEAGVLTAFEANGKECKWQVSPEVPHVTYGPEDTIMAVAFKTPGTYQITVACRVGGELSLYSKSVEVRGDTEDQDPQPPEDKPEPQPEPEPEPEPEPVTRYPHVSQQVVDYCRGLDKEVALSLAVNFGELASKIESGDIAEDQIRRETARANRGVIVKNPSASKIQLIVLQESPSDVDQYVDLWRQIEKGLRKYASTQS